MIRQPSLLVIGYVIAVVLACAALGSLTKMSLDMEASDLESRKEAALEENVRLALWRIDSDLAALIGRESSWPYYAYATAYSVGGTAVDSATPPQARIVSPLSVFNGNWVLARFQIAPDGTVTSPQVGKMVYLDGGLTKVESLLEGLHDPDVRAALSAALPDPDVPTLEAVSRVTRTIKSRGASREQTAAATKGDPTLQGKRNSAELDTRLRFYSGSTAPSARFEATRNLIQGFVSGWSSNFNPGSMSNWWFPPNSQLELRSTPLLSSLSSAASDTTLGYAPPKGDDLSSRYGAIPFDQQLSTMIQAETYSGPYALRPTSELRTNGNVIGNAPVPSVGNATFNSNAPSNGITSFNNGANPLQNNALVLGNAMLSSNWEGQSIQIVAAPSMAAYNPQGGSTITLNGGNANVDAASQFAEITNGVRAHTGGPFVGNTNAANAYLGIAPAGNSAASNNTYSGSTIVGNPFINPPSAMNAYAAGTQIVGGGVMAAGNATSLQGVPIAGNGQVLNGSAQTNNAQVAGGSLFTGGTQLTNGGHVDWNASQLNVHGSQIHLNGMPINRNGSQISVNGTQVTNGAQGLADNQVPVASQGSPISPMRWSNITPTFNVNAGTALDVNGNSGVNGNVNGPANANGVQSRWVSNGAVDNYVQQGNPYLRGNTGAGASFYVDSNAVDEMQTRWNASNPAPLENGAIVSLGNVNLGGNATAQQGALVVNGGNFQPQPPAVAVGGNGIALQQASPVINGNAQPQQLDSAYPLLAGGLPAPLNRQSPIDMANLQGPRLFNDNNQAFQTEVVKVSSVTGVMAPVWSGGALWLARKVDIDGMPYLQGCRIDWKGLQRYLQGLTADLLPEATFEAIVGETKVDSGRLLASIPARIVPGRPAIEPGKISTSSVRPTLAWAWGGLLTAAAAVGLMLWKVTSLSERRASFVSSVTHELRTPLTTFRLYGEMLASNMVSDPERRQEYLETMCAESERLTHLVENVLAYSRLERGHLRGNTAEFSPAEVIAHGESRLRRRAEQAGMSLDVKIADAAAGARLRTDPSAVEQILFNLIDNAGKYAVGKPTREVEIFADADARHVRIGVRDNGPGIGPAERKRLFQPFSKGAREAAESAPGVGLGLALCRRLARELGGDLRYQPGDEGATFVLELPCSSDRR